MSTVLGRSSVTGSNPVTSAVKCTAHCNKSAIHVFLLTRPETLIHMKNCIDLQPFEKDLSWYWDSILVTSNQQMNLLSESIYYQRMLGFFNFKIFRFFF